MSASSTRDALDWPEMKIEQIGEVVSGATPSTSRTEYWDGPVAWVTPVDLSALNSRHLTTSERSLTELGLSHCAARLVPARNLVISARGSVGHMALPVMPFCTNQSCFTLLFHDDHNPDFHYYNLKFWSLRIAEKCEGTTFGSISRSALALVEVPVPRSKNVQASIAAVLSKLDEAIEQTDSVLAKQQRIKTGLMHDLFTRGLDAHGELRHPSTHRFKDSPLGRIPVEWEVRTLAEMVPTNRPIVYGILMPGEYVEGGVPVIKVKDIYGGRIHSEGLLKTDPRIDAAYRRSRLRQGDLLFTIRGSVGRMAVVSSELDGANITQDSARITVAAGNTTFVRHCLEMPDQRAFIDLHTVGQAVKGINLGELRRIAIPCPNPDEQSEIACRLEAHESDTAKLIAEVSKLRRLKTGLMQDLLTGEVSVAPLLALKGTNC